MERIVVVRQQQENTFLDVVAFFDKNKKKCYLRTPTRHKGFGICHVLPADHILMLRSTHFFI